MAAGHVRENAPLSRQCYWFSYLINSREFGINADLMTCLTNCLLLSDWIEFGTSAKPRQRSYNGRAISSAVESG